MLAIGLGVAVVLYAVRIVDIPRGTSVQFDPTHYQQLWEPRSYRRPTTLALARNGTAAVVVTRIRGEETEQRVVVSQRNGATIELPAIPDALIAAHMHAYSLNAHGQRSFSGGRIQDVSLTDDGTVLVTFAFPFSGGYSGHSETSFAWSGRAWGEFLPLHLVTGASNVWVAGASKSTVALVTDFLDQTQEWMSRETTAKQDLRGSVLLLDRGSITAIGRGIATDIAGRYVAGYDSGFQPSSAGCLYSGVIRAMVWSPKSTRSLGSGIVWGINQRGTAVGDDRQSPDATGRPVRWLGGKKVILSTRRGAAYSINERDTIVGMVDSGGFVIPPGATSNSPLRLDSLLRDRSWHVVAAYRISSTGSILAVAARGASSPVVVVLDPATSLP